MPGQTGLITDEIRGLVGISGPLLKASQPLGPAELRRFVQAAMETNPVHFDQVAAGASRYGGLVAPPSYIWAALPRRSGTPDPFDRFKREPGWDGIDRTVGFGGLPAIDLPLQRVLNGGAEAEFFRLPRLGDVICAQSRYADIYDHVGHSGPMVFIEVETSYSDEQGERIARVTTTVIRR